jgi:DNA-binding transcriptional regulator YiaG
MPITFKTVAGERKYRIKEDVYAYLIQSKNGNLFTLDHENNLRTVNSRNSYLDSLDESELLKYLRNAFGISQRELAKMYGVRQCQVAHWENKFRRIPPARRQKIADTLMKAYTLTTTEDGLPVRKEN